MIPRLNQWRPAGFWIASVSLGLVWLASLLGAFDPLSAWVYRQYHGHAPFSRPQPGVTLIEMHVERLQPADWQQLLSQTARLHPAAIGLLQRPEQWQALAGTLPPEISRLLVVPEQPGQGLGVMTIPPAQQADRLGWHQPQVELSEGTFSSLESVLASQASGQPPASLPFLIDFRPGANYLPRLDARRVLAGDLSDHLIRDRVVLIGSPPDGINPPLLTPLPDEAGISRLVHAGYTVDTLLRDQPMQPAPWWQDLALSLAIIGAAAVLYRRLGVNQVPAIAAIGSLLLFAGGWLALQLAGLWLPVVELITLHLLLWGLLARLEQERDWETVRQLLRSQSLHLHQRLIPRDFNTSEDPWGQVLLLCTQLLNLERAILLELVPGAKHVREVKAWRCSIDDISERRRDYNRTPYSTAMAERRPILLEKVYLKDPKPGHRQLLAPLMFNGQLLGFLSGEVTSENLDSNPLLMHLLADCADKIGELLYRRQVWQAQEQRESRSWWRLLQLNSMRAEYQSLTQISRLFERRLALLENVFGHLETCTVLYDLFGQVSQVNRAMEDLARRAELPIFSMTAADVLAALSGMSQAQAREHLQHMLLTRESLCFSARLPGISSTFLLYVRPLQPAEGGAQELDMNPFRIQGFLLELVDVSHLVRLSQLKDEVGHRYNSELHSQLELLLQTARQCNQPALAAAGRDLLQAQLDRQMQQVLQTLGRSQQMLQTVRDISRLTAFPVNARSLLEDTARRWRERLSGSGLTLELAVPDFTAFVRVDVERIAPTLDALLHVLVEDCRAGGSLQLALREQQQEQRLWLHVQLENTGYGMPDEHLQDLLAGSSSAPTPALHRLQQAVKQIGLWGGSVSARSSLGRGIHFEIRLPGTHLDDEPHAPLPYSDSSGAKG